MVLMPIRNELDNIDVYELSLSDTTKRTIDVRDEHIDEGTVELIISEGKDTETRSIFVKDNEFGVLKNKEYMNYILQNGHFFINSVKVSTRVDGDSKSPNHLKGFIYTINNLPTYMSFDLWKVYLIFIKNMRSSNSMVRNRDVVLDMSSSSSKVYNNLIEECIKGWKDNFQNEFELIQALGRFSDTREAINYSDFFRTLGFKRVSYIKTDERNLKVENLSTQKKFDDYTCTKLNDYSTGNREFVDAVNRFSRETGYKKSKYDRTHSLKYDYEPSVSSR